MDVDSGAQGGGSGPGGGAVAPLIVAAPAVLPMGIVNKTLLEYIIDEPAVGILASNTATESPPWPRPKSARNPAPSAVPHLSLRHI